MDIHDLTGSYADFYQTQTDLTASKLEQKLKNKPETDSSKAAEAELMDACKQFEAYFVEQMFKEMAKTVPDAEKGAASSETLKEFYRDSAIREVASTATENQGLGLAQMLFEQMKRNYGL